MLSKLQPSGPHSRRQDGEWDEESHISCLPRGIHTILLLTYYSPEIIHIIILAREDENLHFFFFFLAVLGLRFCARAFSSCGERGPLFTRCAGLSLSRPLLLRGTGSRRAGSAIVAHGPSCSAARGILPDQGSNPCSLHWQADSQPLRHQGSPYTLFLKVSRWPCFLWKIIGFMNVNILLGKNSCLCKQLVVFATKLQRNLFLPTQP